MMCAPWERLQRGHVDAARGRNEVEHAGLGRAEGGALLALGRQHKRRLLLVRRGDQLRVHLQRLDRAWRGPRVCVSATWPKKKKPVPIMTWWSTLKSRASASVLTWPVAGMRSSTSL